MAGAFESRQAGERMPCALPWTRAVIWRRQVIRNSNRFAMIARWMSVQSTAAGWLLPEWHRGARGALDSSAPYATG